MNDGTHVDGLCKNEIIRREGRQQKQNPVNIQYNARSYGEETMKKLIVLVCSLVFVAVSITGVRIANAAPQYKLKPIISKPDKHDVSPKLKSIKPIPPEPGENKEMFIVRKPAPPEGSPKEIDPVVQTTVSMEVQTSPDLSSAILSGASMPSTIQNFDGIYNIYGVMPPDTNGAVGPGHYIQIVNLGFQIWDKNGNSVYGPANTNTLWSGFGGQCETNNNGDPIVLFDHLAGRWVISQFALGPEYYQCIAVSQTDDPTGSWNRYAFFYSHDVMNDYPKFGIWPDGYYMSANQFGSEGGAGVVAFERDKMLNGQAARMIYFDLDPVNSCFTGLLPSDLDGPPPPAGTPNYFSAFDDGGQNCGSSHDNLKIWEFHVDWTTPANSTFGTNGQPDVILTTAPFNLVSHNVPQPDVENTLDTLGDRLMYRLQYRYFNADDPSNAYGAMVTNHTVDSGDGSGRAGIRWYELRNNKSGSGWSGWSINQQGTYAPADTESRWMGSIAMDVQGNIALGYSVSSDTVYPSIRHAGRVVGDPLGTLPQAEASIVEGRASQNGGRWGDYSSMSVDPIDGCTFWYTTEYIESAEPTWRTRIASFKFPGCTTGPTGALWGTVTDATTHNRITGATITATGGYVATTDVAGEYHIPYILAGTYDVTAVADEYASPQTINNVQISSDVTTTLDFLLTSCPSLTLDPVNVTFTASVHGGSVNVTSENGCYWSVTNSLYWVAAGGSGTGNGTVNYTVTTNPTTNIRTGTFTIAGQPFTVKQYGTLEISNPALLSAGFVDTPYSQTLTAAGGLPPYTWEIAPGNSLPDGFNLSSSDGLTGVISGIPSAEGTINFTVKVTDFNSDTATKSISIPVYLITTFTLPPGMVGVDYITTLTATGDQSHHNWTVSSGSLPEGLELDSAGQISGIPKITGAFAFTVELTDDQNSHLSARSYLIRIGTQGNVFSWGFNITGQLGDGSGDNSNIPVQVSGLPGIAALAGGAQHSLALTSDGHVWGWGFDSYGQLGDGTANSKYTPVPVSSLSGITAIAAGWGHSLFLKPDGSVLASGSNRFAQLGDGTKDNRLTPVQVSGLSGVTAIAGGGYHSIALRSDGTVWAWGSNELDQLGDGKAEEWVGEEEGEEDGKRDEEREEGNLENERFGDGSIAVSYTPVQVSALTDVIAIAAGEYHSLALKSDGTVYAWGDGGSGQLGNGSYYNRSTPVKVNGLTGVIAISCGRWHSMALKSDGSVWAWGYNKYGQLGDGGRQGRSSPVQVSGLANVTAIKGEGACSTALKLDGTIWAWGYNDWGQLGDSTNTPSYTPVQVFELTGASVLAGGLNHSIALSDLLFITTYSLPPFTVGEEYHQTLEATGGVIPYTWSISPSSSLPDGIQLDTGSGILWGMPTTAGVFPITVQVTDASTTLKASRKLALVDATRCIDDDNNACTIKAYDPLTGACVNRMITCNDNNLCTLDTCNPATGCVFIPTVPAACNDNDACTTDGCTDNQCTHAAVDCNDHSACTIDYRCDSVKGCVYTRIVCNDFDLCTADTCDSATGACVFTPTVPASCNDLDACTTDGCMNQQCTHIPVDCNDNSACTISYSCDPAQGCVYTRISCDDNNICTTDTCDPATGACVNTPTVLASCNDNDACTTDGCTNNQCTHTPIDCNDNDACTTDGCYGGTGCYHWPVSINDNNACTTDTCDPITGIAHTPVNCDDNNACTTDGCYSGPGCFHWPVYVNDNNACTTDTCDPITGIISHTQVVCNDNNICTTDTCDPATGCVFTPIVCNDNNACTENTCDPARGCVYIPMNFTDNNPCTLDTCDPATGIAHTPINCDDSNACTADSCDTGTGNCVHTPVVIDDNDACTTDTCDPITGIAHTPIVCTDHNACTDDSCNATFGCMFIPINYADNNPCTIDTCDPITGIAHTPIVCNDNNLCTDDSCNPVTGACVYANNIATCDDGNACTLNDTCSGGTCASGPAMMCNDNNVCTDDTCNTATGVCVFTTNTAPCSDGNACTLNDTCSGGVCVPGTALVCDDNIICTTDSCDPASGLCVNTVIADCAKITSITQLGYKVGSLVLLMGTNLCGGLSQCTEQVAFVNQGIETTAVYTSPGTVSFYIPAGAQTGPVQLILNGIVFATSPQPVIVCACDDGNICTTDTCDTATGNCTHTPTVPASCNDYSACTTDGCTDNACTHTPVVCDDNNICTVNSCNSATGCVFTPTVPVSCNDNNACTTDGCTANACTHTAVVCNDNNACTTDTCDPTTGCVYTPIVCNDNNVCTTDTCNTSTGACVFTNNTASCDDGNACTLNDTCSGGVCVPGTAMVCNDSNACTADTCNPSSGCVYTPIVCNDNNTCTNDMCNPASGCVYTPVANGTACTEISNGTCQSGVCVGIDLVPTAITASKAGATKVVVGDTVQNQGSNGAGSFAITYYLSTNTTYEQGTDIVLASNSNGTGTCSRTVTSLASGANNTISNKTCYKPSGAVTEVNYYVLVRDDSGNTVSESNENNNVKATTGTIKW